MTIWIQQTKHPATNSVAGCFWNYEYSCDEGFAGLRAGHRLPACGGKRIIDSIVITARQDSDFVLLHLINEPMLLVNAF